MHEKILEHEWGEWQYRYLTASAKVTEQECQLGSADVCPSAGAGNVRLYDGGDASGKIIHTLYNAVQLNVPFNPRYPIHCEKGIFVSHVANVTATFIQFRLRVKNPSRKESQQGYGS